MARATGGDLLPVEGAHDSFEAGRLLLPHFTDMLKMMHFHLIRSAADATRFAKLGASSHPEGRLYPVDLRITRCKSIALFRPIVVEMEGDLPVTLPILSFDGDRDPAAEPTKDVLDRDFELRCKCPGERVLEDVLDAGEAVDIIDEAVIIQDATVDPVVEPDYLRRVEIRPA